MNYTPIPRANLTQRSEWRVHWPLVAASTAGFSFATVSAASIGVFMEPLSREFGWTRAEISTGLTIFALVAVPLAPLAGALIDRWGARRIALPGVLLTAAAFAAFGLASGSIAQWLALWFAYSFVSVAIKGTVWTTAVSGTFSAGRGLALALTLSGSAITMTFAPAVTQWLVDGFGWRLAYLLLGAGWGGVVLCLLLPFFFDARDRERTRPAVVAAPGAGAALPGLTVTQALRNGALLRIGAATLLTVLVVSSVTIHMVPILSGAGLSRATAALCAGAAGVSSVCGKLATGWMLDRWPGSRIGAVSLTLPALSYLLLLSAKPGVPTVFAAIALLGYANGAFLQVSTYMTSRYAGMRNFGKIYGLLSSVAALGLGVGPVLAGIVFDRFGSYAPLLSAGIPLALGSGLLLVGLGRYPDWSCPPRRWSAGAVPANLTN